MSSEVFKVQMVSAVAGPTGSFYTHFSAINPDIFGRLQEVSTTICHTACVCVLIHALWLNIMIL